jgi:hypothetical protein
MREIVIIVFLMLNFSWLNAQQKTDFHKNELNEGEGFKIAKQKNGLKGKDEKLNILFTNSSVPSIVINVSFDVVQKDSFYYVLGSYPENQFLTKFDFSGNIILQKNNTYLNKPTSLYYHTSNKLIKLSNGKQAYLYVETYIDTIYFHNRHIPVIKIIDNNFTNTNSYYWNDTIDFFPLGGLVENNSKGITYCGQVASRSMTWVQHSSTEGYWRHDSTYLGIVSLDSNLNMKRMSKLYMKHPDCNSDNMHVDDLEKAHDGGYIVGGYVNACAGVDGWAGYSAFIVKFDSLLNHQWTKVLEDSIYKNDSPINIVPSKDGKTYIYTREHTKTQSIAYGKFDDNGSILWEKYFNKTLDTNGNAGVLTIYDRPHGVIEKDNGDIIFGSRINGNRATGLVRTDSMGNVKWSRVISAKYADSALYYSYVFNVKNPIGEGALLVGRVHTMGAFLIRTDSMGCTLPNCLDTTLHVSLEEIVEMQDQKLIVYPNPTQDKVQFAINLQGVKIEELAVYDISGRQVLNEKPDSYLFSYDVSHLSTGVYVVKIKSTSGDFYNGKFVKE